MNKANEIMKDGTKSGMIGNRQIMHSNALEIILAHFLPDLSLRNAGRASLMLAEIITESMK